MDREVDQPCRAVLPGVAAPNDKADYLPYNSQAEYNNHSECSIEKQSNAQRKSDKLCALLHSPNMTRNIYHVLAK